MNETKGNKIIRVLSELFSAKAFIVLGALLLIGSAFPGWIDVPITGWVKGYKIRLSENLPSVISYGLLCFIAGLLFLVALFNRFRWVSVVAGAAGIFLSLSFLLTFSVFDSKKLIAISDLNQQEKRITSFNRYLPPNSGEEPTFDEDISTDTIQDRLYAAFHFSTFGWYAAALGSLFGIIAFMKSGTDKRIKKITLLSIILLIPIYLVLSLSSYLAAEYHRNKGDYYLAACIYSKAVEEYELAKRLDRNIDYQKGFHNNSGKAFYFLSRSDKADYHIFRANIYLQGKDFPTAIFYFNRAESVEPSISKTVGDNFISWAYVNYGLSEYRKGMASSAVESWRKSLETDPSQIQAYYFLSRAYYDIASYEKSIMSGVQFLKLCKNKIMKANVNSNIADSYYKLKDYGLAREHYLKSIFLDKYENVRAVMDLIGK